MPEFALPFLKGMAALCVGGALIASIFFRRVKGRPIVPRAPSDAVFHESWRSGRSLRNALTRFGGARNCLMVYVQGNELVITPKFPFTLMFLPEIFGLEVRAPVTSIAAVERASGPVGRVLRITFAQGGPPPVEVKLRDENGLIRHLGKGLFLNTSFVRWQRQAGFFAPVEDRQSPLPSQKSPLSLHSGQNSLLRNSPETVTDDGAQTLPPRERRKE